MVIPNKTSRKPVKPVIFLSFANDKVDSAQYLRNLPKELHGIRRELAQEEQAGLCEVHERSSATIEDIYNAFQRYKDRIAVFHYGGHATKEQLILETLEGHQSIAHSEGLVSFLGKQKGLQLVFINGCSSESQATKLIEKGISTVVGTNRFC